MREGFVATAFRRALWMQAHARVNRLAKNWHRVIPKGGVCPRNLLFLGSREEKQIPRFARDDKKYSFGVLHWNEALPQSTASPRALDAGASAAVDRATRTSRLEM